MINDLLRDISSTLNISDDIIVFGKTQKEHDATLKAVFQKFAEVNLTLIKKRYEFNKQYHILWVCVLRIRNFPLLQESGCDKKCH